MTALFRGLVYASFVFLAVYLYQQGLLAVPTVRSSPLLIGSILLLGAGFITQTLAWWQVLRRTGHATGVPACVASMGLTVFNKYVPGKIWIVVGRAAYLAQRLDRPLGSMTALSLTDQILSLWAGLTIGAVGALLVGGLGSFGGLLLLSWVVVSLLLFVPSLHALAEWAARTVLRRPVAIPRVDLAAALAVLPWFLATWLFWAAGFSLLCSALSPAPVSAGIGLGFPLATTLAVMAVIAPAGLGVREGILASYLVLAGLAPATATALAVAARFWFLLGEVLLFVSGTVADRLATRGT